jgi:hypothetical protein
MEGSKRQETRARLRRVLEQFLDKVVPEDDSVALPGQGFLAWEDQAEELERRLCTAFLEERASLEEASRPTGLGRCPHCRSDRLYLIPGERQTPLQTRHGPVVLAKRSCRCRACGRTFSPSGA